MTTDIGTVNYLILSKILTDDITSLVRELLQHCISPEQLQDFNNGFLRQKSRLIINRKQEELILNSSDYEDFDLSLLLNILKHVAPENVKPELEDLRKIRNELSHAASTRIEISNSDSILNSICEIGRRIECYLQKQERILRTIFDTRNEFLRAFGFIGNAGNNEEILYSQANEDGILIQRSDGLQIQESIDCVSEVCTSAKLPRDGLNTPSCLVQQIRSDRISPVPNIILRDKISKPSEFEGHLRKVNQKQDQSSVEDHQKKDQPASQDGLREHLSHFSTSQDNPKRKQPANSVNPASQACLKEDSSTSQDHPKEKQPESLVNTVAQACLREDLITRQDHPKENQPESLVKQASQACLQEDLSASRDHPKENQSASLVNPSFQACLIEDLSTSQDHQNESQSASLVNPAFQACLIEDSSTSQDYQKESQSASLVNPAFQACLIEDSSKSQDYQKETKPTSHVNPAFQACLIEDSSASQDHQKENQPASQINQASQACLREVLPTSPVNQFHTNKRNETSSALSQKEIQVSTSAGKNDHEQRDKEFAQKDSCLDRRPNNKLAPSQVSSDTLLLKNVKDLDDFGHTSTNDEYPHKEKITRGQTKETVSKREKMLENRDQDMFFDRNQDNLRLDKYSKDMTTRKKDNKYSRVPRESQISKERKQELTYDGGDSLLKEQGNIGTVYNRTFTTSYEALGVDLRDEELLKIERIKLKKATSNDCSKRDYNGNIVILHPEKPPDCQLALNFQLILEEKMDGKVELHKTLMLPGQGYFDVQPLLRFRNVFVLITPFYEESKVLRHLVNIIVLQSLQNHTTNVVPVLMEKWCSCPDELLPFYPLKFYKTYLEDDGQIYFTKALKKLEHPN